MISLSAARTDDLPSPVSGRRVQLWAVGGGKGGVGKSLISASLAIHLARMGFRVVAVDLDLGGANLHTALGVDFPTQTLGDFFTGRVSRLEQCFTRTEVPNLQLISGAQDSVSIAGIGATERQALLSKLARLDTDFVFMDLGAGTTPSTLDFFLAADIGIVTILPEPTSIENAYRFVRSIYYRKLSRIAELGPVRPLIEAAMDPKNMQGLRSPTDLFREVQKSSPFHAEKFRQAVELLRPKLIVNQARTQGDVEVGESVRSVCKKYFGIDMDYLGALEHDNSAWQAVRKKRPLLLEFPQSRLAMTLLRMAQFTVRRYGHVRTGEVGDV